MAGWQVERFDLDATAESSFSWRAVADLFSKAASTRRLALPCACVEGRAVLRFSDDGLCVAHRESVDMVALAAASRLRNRKVAADTAAFLDVRRPPQVCADAWAAEVALSVLSGVPGAGALDIEPLTDESEGRIAFVLFALVAAAVLGASVSLLGDATGVWGVSVCDEVGESGWAYSQCVSDLFG